MKLNNMKSGVFILSLLCIFSLNALAKVVPNSLFSDNMVLQHGVTVPVWGIADVNENITIEFCGQKVSTVAKNGRWFIKLKPLNPGGPFDMIIKGDNTVKINNILVGEVWVCSGQSNMARMLGPHPVQKPIVNYQKEVNDAVNYPQIRQFTVALKASANKLEDVHGKWMVCDTNTVKSFSAVGFFFARALIQKLKNIPIGLIFSAWGGTPAEKWTSRTALEENDELKSILADYEKSILDYPTVVAKFNLEKDSLLNKWKVDSLKAIANNKYLPLWLRPKTPVKPEYSGDCGGLFNAMIAPLIPYSIKGVIWYQGENNVSKPKQYQTLFPAMIADWRKSWDIGDLPFLFVQVAPFKNLTPEIREAQLLSWKKTPNTAMTVIVDYGDSADIHPANKKPVGERLALSAEAIAYKQKVAFSGPIYSSMEIAGNTIILNFDYVNKGLIVKGGDKLADFVIAGADKKFVPAKAIIRGNQIIVSSDKVTNPIAVRMGWSNVPHINLFNKDGLPASPFRTDI